MNLLKRQFGAGFADALAKSPTLIADLVELRRRKARIRRLPGGEIAYSEKANKLICIGTRCTRAYKLTALAHESYHVLHGTAPIDHIPRGMSRRMCVRLLLDEEADCIAHEMVVVSELLAAGVLLDQECLRWHRKWRRGGYAAIRRAVPRLKNSVTSELYPDYYGRLYDETMAEQTRKRRAA